MNKTLIIFYYGYGKFLFYNQLQLFFKSIDIDSRQFRQMSARIKWTNEQEEKLQEAYVQNGGKWEVIKANGFKRQAITQLKNKYYKITKLDSILVKHSVSMTNISLNDILGLIQVWK